MFVGVELGDSPLDAFADVPNAQACRSRCESNRECAAWNFHVNGTQKSECWLLRSPMGSTRHGAELRARARVRVPSPLRLKTFRKWW